jgi:tRNA(Ile)-lysidine synthase
VHKLAQSVAAYIVKHDLLRPGDRVGVAVSGGADSVALLRLMFELRDELGLVVSVVHLNHKLRGAESDADEQFVRSLAGSHGLEIIAESRDVKAMSAEQKLSLEAAAREARYEFFRTALFSRVNRVATAHTLDDQAETVLLKLTRGAGTRGLAGIYPKRAISRQPSASSKQQPDLDQQVQTIIRPLLGCRRSQLREYLDEIGQSWRDDASNQDLRHTRNRVRHEILPMLERQLNPAVCETLSESSDIARAEEDYWSTEVDRLLPDTWHSSACGGTLKLSPSLSLALRRRLLRAAAESLGITLEFRHVEEILGHGSGDGSSFRSGQWTVAQHNDGITFKQPGQTVSEYQYDLPVPGNVTVAEAGIGLETSLLCGSGPSHQHDNLIHSRFAQHKWVVRNWQAGERFWPAHTKEPKKIKELLQTRHITGEEKQRWPVIACEDEIIWLRGFGVRRDFQANDGDGILIREIQGSYK